jgi:hypothetical protein
VQHRDLLRYDKAAAAAGIRLLASDARRYAGRAMLRSRQGITLSQIPTPQLII